MLQGYVTRVGSLSDFDLNGVHILSNQATTYWTATTDPYSPRSQGGDVFFGEAVSVYGKLDGKKHTVDATEIIFRKPVEHRLSGIAVIDRVLSTDKPDQFLVRADGYPILISKKTETIFQPPLTSLSSVTANTWLKYRGTLNPDGILLADSITFLPNTISDREDDLLYKTGYDPAAVSDTSKQNPVRKFVLGVDFKKIPPYKDTTMQDRIDRIGKSLIPAYQKTLPDTDKSKIVFQFQLVDQPKWHDAISLPSGVILVPHQLIERLENDSQIATLLADNIATALEKQIYRMQPANYTMTAADWASTAGGFFIPGLGLATSLSTGLSRKSIQTDILDQSGRVSLDLLHDAGYDIQQAPIAWWRLAAKPNKDLSQTPLPSRAANLYRSIGVLWRDPSNHSPEPQSPQPTATK